MTYPLLFRQKVFETKTKKNLTFEQTSQLFSISMKTLFRWHKKIQPCMTRRPYTQKIDLEALKKDVENHPDHYQWERAQRFGVSKSGMQSALVRLKITYKKNALSSKSRRSKKRSISAKNQRI